MKVDFSGDWIVTVTLNEGNDSSSVYLCIINEIFFSLLAHDSPYDIVKSMSKFASSLLGVCVFEQAVFWSLWRIYAQAKKRD